MIVHEIDADLFARVQERNLIRQYDLLTNCIEIGIQNAILAEKELRKNQHWEIITPASLGIITFRFVAGLKSEAELSQLNSDMANEMILSGYAMLSPTVMRGKTVLRMCTINPRTSPDDITTTIAKLADIGMAMI